MFIREQYANYQNSLYWDGTARKWIKVLNSLTIQFKKLFQGYFCEPIQLIVTIIVNSSCLDNFKASYDQPNNFYYVS